MNVHRCRGLGFGDGEDRPLAQLASEHGAPCIYRQHACQRPWFGSRSRFVAAGAARGGKATECGGQCEGVPGTEGAGRRRKAQARGREAHAGGN